MNDFLKSQAGTVEVEKLFTRRQFAELIGVHPGSVGRYERAGRIKGLRFNSRTVRYRESEIRRFIQGAAA